MPWFRRVFENIFSLLMFVNRCQKVGDKAVIPLGTQISQRLKDLKIIKLNFNGYYWEYLWKEADFSRCQGLTDQGMTELAAQLSNNGLNQLEILSLDFRK